MSQATKIDRFLKETAQRISDLDRESENAQFTDTETTWALLREIEAQCQALRAESTPATAPTVKQRLTELKRQGLSFADCLAVFGHRAEDNPYVAAAYKSFVDDAGIGFDQHAVVSESEDGAFVSAWVWVDAPESGSEDVPIPVLQSLGYRVVCLDGEEGRFGLVYEDLANPCRGTSDKEFDTEQEAWQDAYRNAVAAHLLPDRT